jgi:hypothetical protein
MNTKSMYISFERRFKYVGHKYQLLFLTTNFYLLIHRFSLQPLIKFQVENFYKRSVGSVLFIGFFICGERSQNLLFTTLSTFEQRTFFFFFFFFFNLIRTTALLSHILKVRGTCTIRTSPNPDVRGNVT